MVNNSTKALQKSNKGNRQRLTVIFAISFVLIIIVPIILMRYNKSLNKTQVMEIKMPDKPANNDTIPSNKKTIHLYLISGNRLFYSIQEGENTGLTLATNSQIDSLVEKNQSAIILIKPCKGSSYKNIIDMFDKFKILGVKRYALVDVKEEEEKKIEIELENR